MNHLQSLGKEGAIAALREFADLSWRGSATGSYSGSRARVAENIDTCDRQCIAPILRLLFEFSGASRHPSMGLGDPTPPIGPSAKGIERFPLVVVRDVPFLIVHHMVLGSGLPQDMDELIDQYERAGVLRSAPLVPADNPFVAARELAAAPGILRDGFKSEELMSQAARMLIGIDGLALPTVPYGFPAPYPRGDWELLFRQVEEQAIRWDPGLGRYVKP